MHARFWTGVLVAVAATWYAFAWAGPRHVYVEVEPEAAMDAADRIATAAETARHNGRGLTGAEMRKVVKEFDLSRCGPGYDIRVTTDGGERWALAILPRTPRAEKTTWAERVLWLRDTMELWPMLSVRCDEPGYHSDQGQSPMLALAAKDSSSIRVERRFEAAPEGLNVRLSMRLPTDGGW